MTATLTVTRRGGASVVARSGGHVPLAARSVPGRPGWARVALVSTTAGPLAGDRIEIDLTVEPGAALELTSVAATLAYPAAERATFRLRCRVGAGGRFAWLAQPLILAAGCDLEARVELELEAGAAALVREWVVLGRHGETAGRYRAVLSCDLAGRPLLRDGVTIGAAAGTPVVLGGARAYGTLALLGVRPDDPAADDELDLAGPGRLLRALGDGVEARLVAAEPGYLAAL